MGGSANSSSQTSNVTETTSIVDSYNTTSNWAQNISGSGNTYNVTSIGADEPSGLAGLFQGPLAETAGKLDIGKFMPMVLIGAGLLVAFLLFKKG